MKYLVKKYHSKYQNQWNAFVQTSANGTFLQQRDYMDYHSDRFEDYSLMIFKEEKLLAVFPAHLSDNQLFVHNGLTYSDVIFLPDFRMAYRIEVYQALFDFLYSEGIAKIHIKTIPAFLMSQKDESNLYLYYKMQADLTEVKPFFVIETTEGIKLNKDRKKNLNRLQKLPFLFSEDKKHLSDFWQIVTTNLANKHQTTPVHSLSEMQLLSQRFPEKIKLFTLFLEGELVSGALVFVINNSLHFQYIHSSTNKQSRQGVDYLIWQILDRYAGDYQFVSFGSSSKGSQALDKGLAYWKQSFGAQMYNQYFYTIDLSNRHLLNDILQ